MKISGCIITYNEQENIKRCIESIRDVCNEIVVLDSGSEDNTQAIARSLGARVIVEPWRGFVHAKNRCSELAQHSYILNLDADEYLDKPAQEAVPALLLTGSTAYAWKRRNFVGKKEVKFGHWNPDVKIRLYPRNSKWKGEAVHETLIPSCKEIETLKGTILHNSFQTIDEFFVKEKQYAELGSIKYADLSLFVRVLRALGSCIMHAIQCFLKGAFLDGSIGLQIWWYSTRMKWHKYMKSR